MNFLTICQGMAVKQSQKTSSACITGYIEIYFLLYKYVCIFVCLFVCMNILFWYKMSICLKSFSHRWPAVSGCCVFCCNTLRTFRMQKLEMATTAAAIILMGSVVKISLNCMECAMTQLLLMFVNHTSSYMLMTVHQTVHVLVPNPIDCTMSVLLP